MTAGAIFVLSGVVAATPPADGLKDAWKAVYFYRFATADSLLQNSGNSVSAILAKSNLLWWKVITGDKNENLRKDFLALIDKGEQELRKKNVLSHEEIYLMITLNGYRARLHALDKNYLKAIPHLNECIVYVKKSFGKENEYPYFMLTSGLYNYHVVNARGTYPFLIPYLSLYPKGNVKKGLEFLFLAAASGDMIMRTEASYFLMKIYQDEKKFSESKKYSRFLTEMYPGNLLFQFYHLRNQLGLNEPEGGKETYRKMLEYSLRNKHLTKQQQEHFKPLVEEEFKRFFSPEKK